MQKSLIEPTKDTPRTLLSDDALSDYSVRDELLTFDISPARSSRETTVEISKCSSEYAEVTARAHQRHSKRLKIANSATC
jgi:hypothetical protein